MALRTLDRIAFGLVLPIIVLIVGMLVITNLIVPGLVLVAGLVYHSGLWDALT